MNMEIQTALEVDFGLAVARLILLPFNIVLAHDILDLLPSALLVVVLEVISNIAGKKIRDQPSSTGGLLHKTSAPAQSTTDSNRTDIENVPASTYRAYSNVQPHQTSSDHSKRSTDSTMVFKQEDYIRLNNEMLLK